MARDFFHEAKFAVLDESTSAVAADVEVVLYERLKDRKVKCVTISQRLAKNLSRFHDLEIQLGVGNEDGFFLHFHDERTVSKARSS